MATDIVIICGIAGTLLALLDGGTMLALFPPAFGLGPRAWTRVRPAVANPGMGLEWIRTKSAVGRRSGPSSFAFRQHVLVGEPWTPFRIKGVVRLEEGRTFFVARVPIGTYVGLAIAAAGYAWNRLGSLVSEGLPGANPTPDPMEFVIVFAVMAGYLVWSWWRQRAWFMAMVDEVYAAIRGARSAR